jgi:hypothetical protein
METIPGVRSLGVCPVVSLLGVQRVGRVHDQAKVQAAERDNRHLGVAYRT